MRQKGRSGIIQGVALSKGSDGGSMKESMYQKFQSKKSAKNYGGQSRSNAAKALRKRGY